MGKVRIGTSGWAYKDWNGPFYPEEVKAKDRLAYISRRFSTLEINASFYRMPTDKAVAAWREQTPDDFVFAWKASRYITHNKKLTDPTDSLTYMFERTEGLGEKIGPILFQLPPSLRRNDQRLSDFLKALPPRGRFVFEFRHPDWYDPAVLDLLRHHGAGFCISDHHHAPAPFEVTADFVYLRGHGPGGRYHGRYGKAALEVWAEHIRRWRKDHDVFVYFDNDIKSAAPADAQQLIDMLSPT
ncbi:DUF72 domain-containing protein [uncultured Brevundimonas sp.]|uniref:DUF72 domain-containing protein n=1 Tax=uncultured Brevundimonas sp. TaxID=213418 RepID=UPI00260258BB|nr:DUF72 domain-containing protein [uncultured Brevundimonas sp.]